MGAAEYLDHAIKSFDRDLPDTEFQRGYLEALKVVRAEAFAPAEHGANSERHAEQIATTVANRCHGDRAPGQSPNRYATIWQAARLGALEALSEQVSA